MAHATCLLTFEVVGCDFAQRDRNLIIHHVIDGLTADKHPRAFRAAAGNTKVIGMLVGVPLLVEDQFLADVVRRLDEVALAACGVRDRLAVA
jgi:hypothetical protein